MRRYFWLLSPVALLVAACATSSDDGSRLVRVDHYVRVKSTAPAFAGQEAKIYVREVVLAGTALRGSAPVGVVLFVHGAGTPAEVTFDVPYNDYSWMAYLAKAGFDVFSMDMTGYGRSTRPPAIRARAVMRRATRRRLRAWWCSRPPTLARPRPKRRTHFRPAAVR